MSAVLVAVAVVAVVACLAGVTLGFLLGRRAAGRCPGCDVDVWRSARHDVTEIGLW